jgi:hypothetical protein
MVFNVFRLTFTAAVSLGSNVEAMIFHPAARRAKQ